MGTEFELREMSPDWRWEVLELDGGTAHNSMNVLRATEPSTSTWHNGTFPAMYTSPQYESSARH